MSVGDSGISQRMPVRVARLRHHPAVARAARALDRLQTGIYPATEGGGRAMRSDHDPLRIALLGCGAVGSQVARLLSEQAVDLAARAGGAIEIAGIAVRRPDIARIDGVDPALITADPAGLVTRPDVDIVVELIGGIEPARSLLHRALDAG